MISINGSYGEGGGQILRTAISLSVLTKKSVIVNNIRANRPNPGLRPQHLIALQILKKISDAKTNGLRVGSSEILFQPKQMQSGSYEFDIGTAGSMVLVFQTILLALVGTKEKVMVKLHGGSDVKWSPSWDYFSEVFLPVIRSMGVSVSVRLMRRGYYPKGGGIAEMIIHPHEKVLNQVLFDSFHPDYIYGRIHLGKLPDHIAKRMNHEVMKRAVKKDVSVNIRTERSDSFSPGVGITLWTIDEKGKFGAVSLGEKGISAEMVGGKAVDFILSDIKSGATIDPFLSDQLLPFISLADGLSRFHVRKITGHCKTNKWVIKHFFPDIHFSFIEENDNVLVSCLNK